MKTACSLALGLAPFFANLLSSFVGESIHALIAGLAIFLTVPVSFIAAFRLADQRVKHLGWNLAAGFALTVGFMACNFAGLIFLVPRSGLDSEG